MGWKDTTRVEAYAWYMGHPGSIFNTIWSNEHLQRGWRPLNIARVSWAWVILGFAALYLQILALDSASSVDQVSLEGPQNCALQNQVDMALLAYDLRQGTPSVNHCVPWLENGE